MSTDVPPYWYCHPVMRDCLWYCSKRSHSDYLLFLLLVNVVKDVITEGENGFLVSEGNIPMLADRMLRLMEDDELRRCMGLSAYHHSKAFSEEKIMQRWIGLFNNLTI